MSIYLKELSSSSPAFHVGSYPVAVVDTGPQAYWRLNETSGTTIVDTMGNVNGTYATGYTLNQTSTLGSAGSTDRSILISNTAAWSLTGLRDALNSTVSTQQVTFEFWADLTNDTLNANFAQWANATQGRILWVHHPWSDGNIYFDTGGSYPDVDRSFVKFEPVATQPHHVVLTKNTATGVQQIWINGNLKVQNTGYTRAFQTPTSGQIAYGMAGYLNDIAIYDRVLSIQEIEDHYAVGAGMTKEIYGTFWAGNDNNPYFTAGGGAGVANNTTQLGAPSESGSFTPTWMDASLSTTEWTAGTSKIGWYQKTGTLVEGYISITGSAWTGLTSTDTAYLGPLPFTAASGNNQGVAEISPASDGLLDLDIGFGDIGYIPAGTNYILFGETWGASTKTISGIDVTAPYECVVWFSYEAAS